MSALVNAAPGALTLAVCAETVFIETCASATAVGHPYPRCGTNRHSSGPFFAPAIRSTPWSCSGGGGFVATS